MSPIWRQRSQKAIPTMHNLIYTIGYERLTVPELAAWAHCTGAAVLDTRFKPWARRSEWSLPALIATVPGYLWLGRCFGNLRYAEPGAPVELADPERGVQIASRLLDRSPICLLCRCAAHDACHRAEVAELIASAVGTTIVPLAADEIRQLVLL